MKPGYKTTEFWLALGSAVAAIVTTLYGLTPTQGADFTAHVHSVIVSVFALFGSAAVAWRYVASREHLKMVDTMTQTVTDPDDDLNTIEIQE